MGLKKGKRKPFNAAASMASIDEQACHQRKMAAARRMTLFDRLAPHLREVANEKGLAAVMKRRAS